MIVLIVFVQSPFLYTSVHSPAREPIAPLQVLAKCVLERPSQGVFDETLGAVARAAVFPGNLVRVPAAQMRAAPNGTAFFGQLFERGLVLSTGKTQWWGFVINRAVLVWGSYALCVGALVSLLLGRVHVLVLIGCGMLGQNVLFIEQERKNRLDPTPQYLGVIVLAVLDLTLQTLQASRAQADQGTGKEAGKSD